MLPKNIKRMNNIYCVLEMFIQTEFTIINVSFLNFRYGYATNTKIKFIIVLQSSNISLRDNDVKMVMFLRI